MSVRLSAMRAVSLLLATAELFFLCSCSVQGSPSSEVAPEGPPPQADVSAYADLYAPALEWGETVGHPYHTHTQAPVMSCDAHAAQEKRRFAQLLLREEAAAQTPANDAEQPRFLAPEQVAPEQGKGEKRSLPFSFTPSARGLQATRGGPLELGAPISLPTPDCSEMCHGTDYPPRRNLSHHKMPVKAWIDVKVPADTEIYIERDQCHQDVFHLYLDNEKQLEILAFVQKAEQSDNLYKPFDNWGPTLEAEGWAAAQRTATLVAEQKKLDLQAEKEERNAMGAEDVEWRERRKQKCDALLRERNAMRAKDKEAEARRDRLDDFIFGCDLESWEFRPTSEWDLECNLADADRKITSMTMPLADFLREQGLLLGHESPKEEEEESSLDGTAVPTPIGMLVFRAQLVSKHHADGLNGLGDEGFDGFLQQNNLFGIMEEGDQRLRLQYTKSFFSFSRETSAIKPWLPALVHDMHEAFLRAMVVREINLEFVPSKSDAGGYSRPPPVRKTVQVQGERVVVDSPIFGKHGKQPVSETPMSLAEFLGWLSESLDQERLHRAAKGDENAASGDEKETFSVKIRFSLFADRENFYPVCEKTPSKDLTKAERKALKQNPKCWDSKNLQCWNSGYPLPNGQLTARNPVLAGGELWRQHGQNFSGKNNELFAVFVTERAAAVMGGSEVPAKIMFIFGPGEPGNMDQMRGMRSSAAHRTRPFRVDGKEFDYQKAGNRNGPADEIGPILHEAIMAHSLGAHVIYAGHSYGAGLALVRSDSHARNQVSCFNSWARKGHTVVGKDMPIHVIVTGVLAMKPSSEDLASSPSRKVWSLVLGGIDEEGATTTTTTKRLDLYGSQISSSSFSTCNELVRGPSLHEHWQLDDRHSWVDIPNNDPNSRRSIFLDDLSARGRMDTRGTKGGWTWQRKGVFSAEVAKLFAQKKKVWMKDYHQFESYRAVLWAMSAAMAA